VPKPEDEAKFLPEPTDHAPTAVEYPDDRTAMLDSLKADLTPEEKNIARLKEAALLKLIDKNDSWWWPSFKTKEEARAYLEKHKDDGQFDQHTLKKKIEARAYLKQLKDDHYSQHSYDKLSSALKGGGFISFKVPIQDATILFWQNLQLT
jgi:hypothetical protein